MAVPPPVSLCKCFPAEFQNREKCYSDNNELNLLSWLKWRQCHFFENRKNLILKDELRLSLPRQKTEREEGNCKSTNYFCVK